MNYIKPILAICFLSGLLSSCELTKVDLPVDINFPLKQVQKFYSDEVIERVAVSDTWIALQTSNSLKAINSSSLEQIWNIPFTSDYVTDSKFLIVDDSFLAAASREKVVLVDNTGKITSMNLNPDEGSVIRFVAIYSDYLYVIRGPNWTLEVYSITNNALLWNTIVGRGGTDVFVDSVLDIAYITTRDNGIRAFKNSTGTILWEQDGSVLHSIFEDGVLYLCESTNDTGSYQISAMNTTTRQIFWKKDVDNVDELYKLTLIDGLLVVSTRDGLIAINKSDSTFVWRILEDDIFYTSPRKFNDVLFVKGASRKVYAITPDTGEVIGFVKFEEDNSIESSFAAEGEVYLLLDGIAFNTRNMLILYKE